MKSTHSKSRDRDLSGTKWILSDGNGSFEKHCVKMRLFQLDALDALYAESFMMSAQDE